MYISEVYTSFAVQIGFPLKLKIYKMCLKLYRHCGSRAPLRLWSIVQQRGSPVAPHDVGAHAAEDTQATFSAACRSAPSYDHQACCSQACFA